MPSCFQCGEKIADGQGCRREVQTGSSFGYRSTSVRIYRGVRTLCPSCAKRHDDAANLAMTIFLVILGFVGVGGPQPQTGDAGAGGDLGGGAPLASAGYGRHAGQPFAASRTRTPTPRFEAPAARTHESLLGLGLGAASRSPPGSWRAVPLGVGLGTACPGTEA